MSRHASKHYIYGIALTHEQATQIKNDDFYGVDEDVNDVFLFTDNQNFYRDVSMEYDKDPSVPHFIGVEIEWAGSSLPQMTSLDDEVQSFNAYAQPLIDKYQISEMPVLHVIQQVS